MDRTTLLAFDIGNTAIKAGLFVEGELVTKRVSLTQGADVRSLLDNLPTAPQAAAICSVVPAATHAVEAGIEDAYRIFPWEIGPSTDFGLRIHPDPATGVGRDRLVNAAAGFEHVGGPVVVVSIGTATTVDAVSSRAEFLGGAIAPGPQTAYSALAQAGAQLPHAPFAVPERAIGRNTVEAMQSGGVLGYAELLDGLVARVRAEMAENCKVVVTGGWAPLFMGVCSSFDLHLPNLTLDGIHCVWKRNV